MQRDHLGHMNVQECLAVIKPAAIFAQLEQSQSKSCYANANANANAKADADSGSASASALPDVPWLEQHLDVTV